ncbi:MAG: hypothetical protein PVG39_02030 [Desulfobacteraceae bacterium]
MNFKELHERFKDEGSPSVEGQIRWLQKMGFGQHQIEQAMLMVYTELENEKLPKRWKRTVKKDGRQEITERVYLPADHKGPGPEWECRDIKDGNDLDQFLLEAARKVRTEELNQMVSNMEKLKSKLEADWKKRILSKRPWYKRMLGIKSALKKEEK